MTHPDPRACDAALLRELDQHIERLASSAAALQTGAFPGGPRVSFTAQTLEHALRVAKRLRERLAESGG